MKIVKDIILIIILTVICTVMNIFADKKCRNKFLVGYITGGIVMKLILIL